MSPIMTKSASETAGANGVTVNPKDLYLYDMPAKERHNLCIILDNSGSWTTLADHMKYESKDIQEIKRASQSGNSPSDELLFMWGQLNHTVTELFVLLSRMKHYQAMDAIKSLVDSGYHRLLQPIIDKKNEMDHMANKMNLVSVSSKVCKINNGGKILNGPAEHSVEDNERVGVSHNSTVSAGARVRHAFEYAGNILHINYIELVIATENWSKENILGRGGFGIVYKGKWKQTEVAIKKMQYKDQKSAQAIRIQMQQSLNELRHLNSFRHDNILPVYGYSVHEEEPCLVYQLMLGGSLEHRLYAKPMVDPLNWRQRLNIARGTARGLQFLHTVAEKPLIHGDIKPANILLDPCCMPKIADFGLAREGPHATNSEKVVSQVYGTLPYLAPEFIREKRLSTKVDTYGFGVVLFELASGLRAYERERNPKYLAYYMKALIGGGIPFYELRDKSCGSIEDDVHMACEKLMKLGLSCTAERPENRPEMVEVLTELERN